MTVDLREYFANIKKTHKDSEQSPVYFDSASNNAIWLPLQSNRRFVNVSGQVEVKFGFVLPSEQRSKAITDTIASTFQVDESAPYELGSVTSVAPVAEKPTGYLGILRNIPGYKSAVKAVHGRVASPRHSPRTSVSPSSSIDSLSSSDDHVMLFLDIISATDLPPIKNFFKLGIDMASSSDMSA